jgi:hypothetical protein
MVVVNAATNASSSSFCHIRGARVRRTVVVVAVEKLVQDLWPRLLAVFISTVELHRQGGMMYFCNSTVH